MLRGKRGFTLLELLIVLLITALTLPVVGMAFYTLLHVPAKETSKLSCINDVNLALNWIHEDINRGQFFSGAPGMLKGITTVDFSSGAGSDQMAWEQLDIPTNPSFWGDELGTTATDPYNYSHIAASDSLEWVTELATADGEYDTHMFKFSIPAELDLDEIETAVISWKGFGESQSDYETEMKVWCNTTDQWESFSPNPALRSGMGSEGWLSGRIRNIEDYIYPLDDCMYVLVQSKHYYDEGCPFLYGWDGESYRYIDTTLLEAFFKRYETTTFHKTAYLEPQDGYYDLMLFQGLPETSYINNLGLLAVDHPQDTEIVLERSPEAGGPATPHTIRNPQPVTAWDRDGNDVTRLLAEQDKTYWESDLSGKDFSDEEILYDWIVLTLPEERDSGSAKLLIDVRESALGEFEQWYFLHYMLGTPNVDYIRDRIESDQDLIPHFDLQMWLTTAFIVQYWDGSEWVDYTSIPALDMNFGNPQTVMLDLSEICSDKIRLYTPIGLREIDYIAADYSEDEELSITQVTPDEAIKHCADGTTSDVLEEVLADDDSYAVIEQGEYINYRLAAIEPPAEGMQRTYVFPVGGYYYLQGPEVPEDKLDNLDLWEELAYIPNAYSKWILPRYANMEDYPCSEYYHCTSISPPFPTTREKDDDGYSLHTDYIKVVLLSPGDPPPYEPVNTYGGFYWVDRTGDEPVTYTSHYYFTGNQTHQLIREEWQDNDLASTTILAFNVKEYDHISMEYFPAGTMSAGDILPYIIVHIQASTGNGSYYVEAFGDSHIVLKSTTLSRGYAVLAKEIAGTGKETVNVSGNNLIVDGHMRSFGNITVTGEDNLVTGISEAGAYIFDEPGAIVNPNEYQYIDDVDWDLSMDNFVDDYTDPASNEYIWTDGSDIVLDTSVTTDGNGKSIWYDTNASAPVLNPGVYYVANGGNLTLAADNVRGMVTLASENKVEISGDSSDLSPFCNGVILFGNGTADYTVTFSGDGGTWSGNMFAPNGGITITGTMTEEFYLFGSVAGKRFNYEADSDEPFRIKF